MFTWKDAPDLMSRLVVAQNSIHAPIDIVSFAGFCNSRAELEAHVVRYEARAAADAAKVTQPRRRAA